MALAIIIVDSWDATLDLFPGLQDGSFSADGRVFATTALRSPSKRADTLHSPNGAQRPRRPDTLLRLLNAGRHLLLPLAAATAPPDPLDRARSLRARL